MDEYGNSGRAKYLCGFVPLDTAFPALGGFFLAFVIGGLYKVTAGAAGPWQLIAVPLASWLLDWMENIFFVTMVLSYPLRPTKFAWLGYGVSISKLITLGTSFAIVFVMVLRCLLLRPARQHDQRLLEKASMGPPPSMHISTTAGCNVCCKSAQQGAT
jgi:hypothetical protein